jgi:hypothetical protein
MMQTASQARGFEFTILCFLPFDVAFYYDYTQARIPLAGQ